MTRDSRFLSMVLRHNPDSIGLKLDENGWASVDDLLRKMKAVNRKLTRLELEEIVSTNEKKRFTLSEDRTKIRAAQGHSFPIDLGLPPKVPPSTLFHGTARSNLDQIFRDGLQPKGRSQVHLSNDTETAKQVGERHGKPVVLKVDAGRMHSNGFEFFRADNGVWLCDAVPPIYLGF